MRSVICSFITLELYTHLIGITVEQVISVLSRQYEQLHVAVGPGAHIEGLYDTEKECQLPQHWRHVRHLATYLFLGIFCRQSLVFMLMSWTTYIVTNNTLDFVVLNQVAGTVKYKAELRTKEIKTNATGSINKNFTYKS